jgi:hypothetical protein
MSDHKCTACECNYTDDEGGVQGYFGVLYMSFCPTCFSSICDMVEQLCPKEWIGLDDMTRKEIMLAEKNKWGKSAWEWEACKAVEEKLRELNEFTP